jgi:GDP-L-fucose synthase
MGFDLQNAKVWVAGHGGMVGSAIVRRLADAGCEILTPSRQDLDLLRQSDVEQWLATTKPDAIFLAAAKVGGIHANSTYPAHFIYENLTIASNIIHGAHKADVDRLLFLGSSCIYPRLAPQPIPEDALLTGPLEPTNEWYAIAKIAGIKLCQSYARQYGRAYFSAMPTNLYGPGDNFHPMNSHVPAALLQRFHAAKAEQSPSVTVWGSGRPLREFMHVDDLADACVFLMQNHSGADVINVGSGDEITIADFARLIAQTVGFSGELIFDTDKPDGMPRKLLDSSRLRRMGWVPKITLSVGLERYYDWFLAHQHTLRGQ